MIVVLVPLVLVGASVRMLLTDVYLRFEYGRSGFPADMFGFTAEERLEWASQAVEYLVMNQPLEYLAGQTFESGLAVYNERELRHMVDVQGVVVVVLRLFLIGVVFFGLLCVVLFVNLTTRNILRDGLLRGSILTLGLILTLVLIAVLSWNTFFVQFHQLFFEDGTWRFDYSDTLIRLFPEQFWFDAALTIGVLTATGALGILLFTWLWRPNQAAGAE